MIWITSYDDGNIESYASLTRKNKIEYAERHGYRYLLAQGKNHEEPDLSPPWCLVATVRQAMEMSEEGDWITLLGADAAIVDMEFKLEWLTAQDALPYPGSKEWPMNYNADLLITRDRNGLNTNGILIRNCEWSRELVERWWALRGTVSEIHTNEHIHFWHEQGILFYLLGEPGFVGITSGNYDNVKIEPMPDVKKHVSFIPQNIVNCYPAPLFGPDEAMEPVFVVHTPGTSHEIRTAYFRKLLEKNES